MFPIGVLMLFLRIGMLFVPQEKYEQKVSRISSMDEKNAGFDLRGWEYRTLVSPDSNLVHRYYYYPSRKENAPVFLLFHGLNLDGRTFLYLKGLAQQWQLVAYDLPEQSPHYEGEFNDYMLYLNDFIERMGISRCCLLGVSAGGSIALHLAASHPKLEPQGLVLASTAIFGDNEREREQYRRRAQWVKSLPDYKLYWLMEKMVGLATRNSEGGGRRSVRKILRVKHPDYYRQVMLAGAGRDTSEDARKVDCPVLMLIGDKDNLFSRKQARKIKEYIPHAEFEVIEGGGHGMVYECGEVIAKRIETFQQSHCPPAER